MDLTNLIIIVGILLFIDVILVFIVGLKVVKWLMLGTIILVIIAALTLL